MHSPKHAFRVFALALLFSCFSGQPLHGGEKCETGLLSVSHGPMRQAVASQEKDPWFGKDKVQHFVVSAFLTGYTYVALKESLDVGQNRSTYWASGISLSLGVGKEVADLKRKRGHASLKDLLADILGVAAAAFVIQIL